VAKKVWRKPEVKTLRAGAAETNPGKIVDDGDPGTAINNS
jgi:hypothetical protein